jgi:hypothetical protein
MGALALPLLFALPPTVDAADVTLRVKARLREGASKNTPLLGWVEAGTVVEVLEETAGWRQVRVPDGRTGYIWGEHFAKSDSEPQAASGGVAEAASPPSTQPAVPDDLRSVRSDLDALRNRPEPASAAALEQLRGEVGRLTTAQQELVRRLDARGVASPAAGAPVGALPTTPLDGTASAAVVFLAAGAFVGWIASRLMQRWRDRRSRIRI